MSVSRHLLSILASGALLAFSHAEAHEHQLMLRASPLSQSVKLGDPVWITIVQTNIGPSDEKIAEDNAARVYPEFDFDVRIHDENGRIPPYTKYGEENLSPNRLRRVGGYKPVTIKKGESRTSYLDIRSIFVLARQHRYSVSVSWNKAVSNQSTPLVANWVTISVQ